MLASCRNSQKTWIIQWTFSVFYVAAVLRGIQAEKDVCHEEEILLSCPKLESEIKSGDYKELDWTVIDPNAKSKVKQPLVYCAEDLSCKRYPRIGVFETRIKIGNSTRGKLNVTLTGVKNDLLTFSCYIQRKKDAETPPPDQVNVSSSVNCLSLEAGQDVILNQAMGEMPSTEIIEDIDWYWIKPDGQKQKIVSCNPTTCSFEDCNGSCPRSRPRLKIDGVNLMLMNVEKEDRGLKLECRMYPKTVGRTTTKILKIKDVLPSDSSFSTTSQSKDLKTPSQSSSQSPSQTPTRSTTAWVHGTQYSAGSRVLAFTAVFVSLVISLLEIS